MKSVMSADTPALAVLPRSVSPQEASRKSEGKARMVELLYM